MKKNDKQAEKEIQIVIFRLQQEEFGIEISHVLEITRMGEITHIPAAPEFVAGVINLRGQVITVIDLAKQFDLPVLSALPHTARIIIVEVGNMTLGIIVDEVPEVLKIAEKNIESTPDFIKTKIQSNYIKGVGKLGERLIVMLDLSELDKLQENGATKISKGADNG